MVVIVALSAAAPVALAQSAEARVVVTADSAAAVHLAPPPVTASVTGRGR